MLECFTDGDPFGWVQHEALIQQVFELCHFTHLVFWKALVADQVSHHVLRWVDHRHDGHFFLESYQQQQLSVVNNIF